MRIHEAAAAGDVEEAGRILGEFPGYVNVRDSNGQTPLHIATDRNQVEMVRLLLEKGADPNARNKGGTLEETSVPGGWSPLHLAAMDIHDYAKSGAIAELLIAHGADIDDASNDMRWPPLFIAVREGNYVVEELLRRNGAVWGRDSGS